MPYHRQGHEHRERHWPQRSVEKETGHQAEDGTEPEHQCGVQRRGASRQRTEVANVLRRPCGAGETEAADDHRDRGHDEPNRVDAEHDHRREKQRSAKLHGETDAELPRRNLWREMPHVVELGRDHAYDADPEVQRKRGGRHAEILDIGERSVRDECHETARAECHRERVDDRPPAVVAPVRKHLPALAQGAHERLQHDSAGR